MGKDCKWEVQSPNKANRDGSLSVVTVHLLGVGIPTEHLAGNVILPMKDQVQMEKSRGTVPDPKNHSCFMTAVASVCVCMTPGAPIFICEPRECGWKIRWRATLKVIHAQESAQAAKKLKR